MLGNDAVSGLGSETQATIHDRGMNSFDSLISVLDNPFLNTNVPSNSGGGQPDFMPFEWTGDWDSFDMGSFPNQMQ